MVDTDRRLEQLQTELALMVETSNEEIAAIDRQIAELQQQRAERFLASLESINVQRGRIAEREDALNNAPQSNGNAPLSVLRGSQSAIIEEREKEA